MAPGVLGQLENSGFNQVALFDRRHKLPVSCVHICTPQTVQCFKVRILVENGRTLRSFERNMLSEWQYLAAAGPMIATKVPIAHKF